MFACVVPLSQSSSRDLDYLLGCSVTEIKMYIKKVAVNYHIRNYSEINNYSVHAENILSWTKFVQHNIVIGNTSGVI